MATDSNLNRINVFPSTSSFTSNSSSVGTNDLSFVPFELSLNTANAVTLTKGTWTATGNGMFYCRSYTGTWGSQSVTVNGLEVGRWRGKECGASIIVPVKKGDVVVMTTSATSEDVFTYVPFN